MSVALLRAVHAVQPVYYGHIGTIHTCVLIIRVSMIIQVSLQINAKAHFETMYKVCGLCRRPYFHIILS